MRRLATTLLLYIVTVTPAPAETYRIFYDNGRVHESYPAGVRPVIGLALSGGGARGLAHIGVIDILERNGIEVDRIAGTSMGSVIGGLYAAGYSVEYLVQLFEGMNFSEAMGSTPDRRKSYLGQKELSDWPLFELRFNGLKAQIPASISTGQGLSTALSWLCLQPTYDSGRDFDRLPIPFRSVCTDLVSGEKVVIGTGNLGRALQASSTIPLLFKPVPFGDSLLVDGGIVDNLPVSVARSMGSDFVITVPVVQSLLPSEELENPLNIARQVTAIPMSKASGESRDKADFVITPDVEQFPSADFSNVPAIIEAGRSAARASLPDLLDALRVRSRTTDNIALHAISVSPTRLETFARSTVAPYIDSNGNTRPDLIIRGVKALWDTGRFCDVRAELDRGAGVLALRLTPVPETVRLTVMGQENGVPFTRRETILAGPEGGMSVSELMTRVDAVLHSIRASGHSFAHIEDTRIVPQTGAIEMTVTVPQLADIAIAPGITTRHTVITREIKARIGEPFDVADAVETVDNLYGTNLFEWVYADIERFNGGVRLIINLKEKKWLVARFGLRYDDLNHTEGRVNLSRENILGFGNHFSTTMQLGERARILMVENWNDRIYNTFLTSSIKLYRHYRLRPVWAAHDIISDYQDDRFGLLIGIGQQMDKLGNALIQLKHENIWINTDPASRSKGRKKELRTLVFHSVLDSYDTYPFPTRGKLNLIYIETTADMLGGTEEFVKLFWGGSVVRTFAKRHTLSFSFALGTADPTIPEIEAFTLGGPPTRLGSHDPDTAGGQVYADFMGLGSEERFGNRLTSAGLTYRIFVPKYFHLDMVYNIGNAWRPGETITTGAMLQGYGVRASFSTYGGPLSAAWGITSEGEDRIYLNAGWEF